MEVNTSQCPATHESSEQVGSSTTLRSNDGWKKRSWVWDEFSMLSSDELRQYEEKHSITKSRERAKCTWCEKVLIAESNSGTTSIRRHLDKCAKRPDGLGEIGGQRLETDLCREMFAECVIAYGYPFEWVEHEKTRALFSYLNKKFKPISRNTCKADC